MPKSEMFSFLSKTGRILSVVVISILELLLQTKSHHCFQRKCKVNASNGAGMSNKL
jgi:hypothetical protein